MFVVMNNSRARPTVHLLIIMLIDCFQPAVKPAGFEKTNDDKIYWKVGREAESTTLLTWLSEMARGFESLTFRR